MRWSDLIPHSQWVKVHTEPVGWSYLTCAHDMRCIHTNTRTIYGYSGRAADISISWEALLSRWQGKLWFRRHSIRKLKLGFIAAEGRMRVTA